MKSLNTRHNTCTFSPTVVTISVRVETKDTMWILSRKIRGNSISMVISFRLVLKMCAILWICAMRLIIDSISSNQVICRNSQDHFYWWRRIRFLLIRNRFLHYQELMRHLHRCRRIPNGKKWQWWFSFHVIHSLIPNQNEWYRTMQCISICHSALDLCHRLFLYSDYKTKTKRKTVL